MYITFTCTEYLAAIHVTEKDCIFIMYATHVKMA